MCVGQESVRVVNSNARLLAARRGELAPSSPPPPPGHVAKPPLQRVPPSAEPVSMSTVIGIVIACLVILVLVTLIVLYAFKTEKWCFSRKYSSCSSLFSPSRAAPPGTRVGWTLTLSNTWLLHRLRTAWLVRLSCHCRIDSLLWLMWQPFPFFQ